MPAELLCRVRCGRASDDGREFMMCLTLWYCVGGLYLQVELARVLRGKRGSSDVGGAATWIVCVVCVSGGSRVRTRRWRGQWSWHSQLGCVCVVHGVAEPKAIATLSCQRYRDKLRVNLHRCGHPTKVTCTCRWSMVSCMQKIRRSEVGISYDGW
jgi:hypothetical protein